MIKVREVVALALAERAAAGIKVRQPLGRLKIKIGKFAAEKELMELIKDEVNVKEIVFDETLKTEIKLDRKLTKELRNEGFIRELIRQLQDMRKEAGFTRKNKMQLKLESKSPKINKLLLSWEKTINKETLAEKFVPGKKEVRFALEKDLNVDEGKIKAAISKK